MGAKARLFTPLYARSLDELVPADHFYRHVDRVLDLSFVPDMVQDCYAAGMGRPSVDPRVFFKLQLVMFFEGIRSERQLLRLAADWLSLRWFLGLYLGRAVAGSFQPDPHSRSLWPALKRQTPELIRSFAGTGDDCASMLREDQRE